MERAGITLFEIETTQSPYLPNDFIKIGVISDLDENNTPQYQIDDCP